MALFFSKILLSYIHKDIHLSFFCLKVLTYPLISDNIRTNGHITSSKYPAKCVGLFFISNNFEITILSTLTSHFFFYIIKLFSYFCLTKSQHYYTIKKFCCHYFSPFLYCLCANTFLS